MLSKGSKEEHLERLRRHEVESLKRYYTPGHRVLEIGGGSGFQASILASWGCKVTSIDIESSDRSPAVHHPVETYDGRRLPFDGDSFDRIWSSNVLEHVEDLPTLLGEMVRVLVPEGLMVHVLPTPAWRFWTSLTHWTVLPQIRQWIQDADRAPRSVPAGASQGKPLAAWATIAWNVVWPRPHGAHGGSLSELYRFSQRQWTEFFRANGLRVSEVAPNRLFYSGYGVFPGLPMGIRMALAHLLGSSCRAYVLHP